MIPWTEIHTVFFDMDGTLLDLHFDNYFWQEVVPRRYAEFKNLPLELARPEFIAMCKRIEGTLDWYCLDYWTDTLGVDIALLKEEVVHLIAEHPHVNEFLQAVRNSGRRTVLVTNAHHKSLHLKLRYTRIGSYFHRIFSTHEFGLPKEDVRLWARLHEQEPFDPAHTLLIDDSLSVLHSAHQYGIAHLRAVRCPDSHQPPRKNSEFIMIEDFSSELSAFKLNAYPTHNVDGN